MQERSVREGDLRNALVNVGVCSEQDDGTWRVKGNDLDGDELTVVVTLF